MKGKFKMVTTSLDKALLRNNDKALLRNNDEALLRNNNTMPNNSPFPNSAIMEQEWLLEATFDEHWTWVHETLCRIVGDVDEAEDLALEVFYRLYQRPPKDLTRGPQALSSWLYRVATNIGLNALRARQRRRRHEEAGGVLMLQHAPSADPALEVERREMQADVRVVLARMKPRWAQLLILRHSGLSYQEIAAVLNIAPGSVGTLLVRAEKDFERRYRNKPGF
ncbi:MAG: sigma-70 family RNA polymerase sigma factor [Anaerolineae bacterium]|nr:sigma-70 family RNA polymerase sigma factor [Anaerolineae bacterium]